MSITTDQTATRRPDAERTRTDILAVAHAEFVQHGLSGARVDAIAERTRTTKRMIYYYFGSKEGLYSAVLERAYAAIREAESGLALAALDPLTALRRLILFSFDYADSNPDFVQLIAIENIHHASYLRQLPGIQNVNAGIIATLDAILTKGRAQGIFTRACDAVDLHMMINGFSFYRVSNRHTFGALFGRDLAAPAVREQHQEMIVDLIVGYLRTG